MDGWQEEDKKEEKRWNRKGQEMGGEEKASEEMKQIGWSPLTDKWINGPIHYYLALVLSFDTIKPKRLVDKQYPLAIVRVLNDKKYDKINRKS